MTGSCVSLTTLLREVVIMSAPPVKKACDACHRRKVRCTGGQPCKNCGQASLQCTYLAIPQKKGPKGSRAKVISEIRDKQSVRSPTTSTKTHHDSELNPFDFNTSPISPGYTRNPDLLTPQMIESCLVFFFSHLYPTMPIFSRQRLDELINNQRESSVEVHCMTLSLCAFVMAQPGVTFQDTNTNIDGVEADARATHANLLLEETRRLRKSFDYVESPTLLSVQISFFMFSAYFCLERSNQMNYHMREAGTLAQLIGMGEESTYRTGDPVENMYRRRLYWLILVTERAYAMERHRPLTLYASIELPTIEEEPQAAGILHGFLSLVRLYRLIDDEFMSVWNKAKSECSTAWLSELQQQLIDALPPELECTENQAADVRVTQHWLRTMVWQLSITNGYLSSSSSDVAMTFTYPIEIARDLVRDVQGFSQHSMEVHGIGLIEKLFDIACTLTDVIACVPLDNGHSSSVESPSDCLNQLLNLISRLRGGASRYQPLLVAKVSENLPSLTAYHDLPSTQRLQFPSVAHNRNGTPSPLPHLAPAAQQIQTHNVFGPTSPFNDQHRGLMFDTYSPSLSHGSEIAMTPMTPGAPMAGSPLGPPPQGQIQNMSGGGPRSMPTINEVGTKYESYN